MWWRIWSCSIRWLRKVKLLRFPARRLRVRLALARRVVGLASWDHRVLLVCRLS
jgi:hypothetical protein